MTDQDAELIEKIARAIEGPVVSSVFDPNVQRVYGAIWARIERGRYLAKARAALAIARPVIEAQMREKAARNVDNWRREILNTDVGRGNEIVEVVREVMSGFFGKCALSIRSIPLTGEAAE